MDNTRNEVLTPAHPLWQQFCVRLGGPEGCNFREEGGQMVWTCDHKAKAAFEIMKSLPGIDVIRSLIWMSCHGGRCDCEILFNCDPANAELASPRAE